MDHTTHALLILATAIFLAGGGIVVLGLGWRRRHLGERSAMVVGSLTPRQQVLSLVGVPVVGLVAFVSIAGGAALMR